MLLVFVEDIWTWTIKNTNHLNLSEEEMAIKQIKNTLNVHIRVSLKMPLSMFAH